PLLAAGAWVRWGAGA
ncbi:hypothetical protein, partial [Paracoccus aminovorans]